MKGTKSSPTGFFKDGFIWAGILLGILYWVLESAIHVVFFRHGPFTDQLFTIDPHEIWKRLLVMSLLVLLGFYAQITINARKRSEEALRESEKRFRTLFEEALNPILVFDEHGRCLKYNLAALHFLECGPEAMENHTLWDFGLPEPFMPRQEKVPFFPEGLILEGECPVRGGLKTILLNLVPLNLSGQRLLYAIGQDISGRKHMERTIHRMHGELNQIFQTAAVGLRVVDKNYNMLKINRTLAAMTGVNEKEAAGKKCYEIFAGAMCGRSDCPMKQILRGETRVECTVDKRRPDGTIIPCILNASPFLGPEGECVGIVESFRDITVIKRAEQLAALGEVAAGVAHEINNPINGIINYAQILINRNQGEGPLQEIPRRIIKEGERIARIVEGLLAFARREIDVKMPVALGNIIAESMALTGAQMRRDGIILRCETPGDLPPVQACPRQIEQVFINILSNARHALNQRYPEAHENKLLEVSAGTLILEDRPFVLVSFLDRGVGIPAGVIGQITSPFFSTKMDEKSTGLGLSISQGILQDHDGRLMFDSVEGEFTRVDVALPVWLEKGETPHWRARDHG